MEENKITPSQTGLRRAMIFAAGLGTRFKPWTDQHPKALALVNGKSLLQRTVEYLRSYGITDPVVNVHHMADQIIEAIEKNKGWGSNIIVSDETGTLLETGGGLLKARQHLEGEPFLTINVDILTDANLKHFLARHQLEQALITLAVTDRQTSRYLLFNKYNRLIGWRNVSTSEEKIVIRTKDIIQKAYSGLAIFAPEVFDLIRLEGKFSLIDLYLDLAPENKIAGFDHTESKLLDVGKPDSVERAQALFP